MMNLWLRGCLIVTMAQSVLCLANVEGSVGNTTNLTATVTVKDTGCGFTSVNSYTVAPGRYTTVDMSGCTTTVTGYLQDGKNKITLPTTTASGFNWFCNFNIKKANNGYVIAVEKQ